MRTFDKVGNKWISRSFIKSTYIDDVLGEYKEKYQTAQIDTRFAFRSYDIEEDGEYYDIVITFNNDADECEFIIRESV
jgi:hypothetical protein